MKLKELMEIIPFRQNIIITRDGKEIFHTLKLAPQEPIQNMEQSKVFNIRTNIDNELIIELGE